MRLVRRARSARQEIAAGGRAAAKHGRPAGAGAAALRAHAGAGMARRLHFSSMMQTAPKYCRWLLSRGLLDTSLGLCLAAAPLLHAAPVTQATQATQATEATQAADSIPMPA